MSVDRDQRHTPTDGTVRLTGAGSHVAAPLDRGAPVTTRVPAYVWDIIGDGERIRAMYRTYPDATPTQIAKALGVSERAVKAVRASDTLAVAEAKTYKPKPTVKRGHWRYAQSATPNLPLPPGAVWLAPNDLPVILALTSGERHTMRTLMPLAGVTSTSTIKARLDRLRSIGLVTWDRARNGTLRPLVQQVEL